MENKTEQNQPTHHIYHVKPGQDDKSAWVRLGAAWPHKDGKGFNLKFDAAPVDYNGVVLRVPMDKRP